MSDFKVIETQEQLNAIIAERITKVKEATREETKKEFEGYISPDDQQKFADKQKERESELEKQIKGLTGQLNENKKGIAERDEKIAKYEADSVKNRIAHELGLAYDAVSYIKGTTEEEIKKSAEGLKKIIGAKTPPLSDPEGGDGGNSSKAAYRKMLKNMKGE
jgi:hypothetical protein